MPQLIREQRLMAMNDAIRRWQRSRCIERAYWRSTARAAISEFRTRHILPEAAAFAAAVAQSKQRSRAR